MQYDLSSIFFSAKILGPNTVIALLSGSRLQITFVVFTKVYESLLSHYNRNVLKSESLLRKNNFTFIIFSRKQSQKLKIKYFKCFQDSYHALGDN